LSVFGEEVKGRALAEEDELGELPEAVTEEQRVVVENTRKERYNHFVKDVAIVDDANEGKTRQLRVAVVVFV
jgi:hypothetical protein